MYICPKKHEGKRPIRRPDSSWRDNIKTNLEKIGTDLVNWIYRLQNTDQWQDVYNIFRSTTFLEFIV